MSTDLTWRLELLTNKPVTTTESGRVRVPLWLLRDRRHHTDLLLDLRTYEAELLHAKLCFALAALSADLLPTTPACRP